MGGVKETGECLWWCGDAIKVRDSASEDEQLARPRGRGKFFLPEHPSPVSAPDLAVWVFYRVVPSRTSLLLWVTSSSWQLSSRCPAPSHPSGI